MNEVRFNYIRFDCSGREFYAFKFTIGISNIGQVKQGWDGEIDGIDDFTPEERAELADHMIALWQRFKRCGSLSASVFD